MSAAHPTPTTVTPASFFEKFYKRLGKVVFWVSVVIMSLVVLRVMQNPAAIPMALTAVIVLTSYSVVWGASSFGRKMAMYAAMFILLLAIASFLLPKTYTQTIPSRDEIGQKLVDRGLIGGAWDGMKTLAFGKSAEATTEVTAEAKQVVEVNPRPEQIRFQNGECHPALIKLAGNWFSYPVGGPVNFVDESGNIVHTSEPGSDKEFTMNDGWYRVCPKEKQTRGVDIIRRPW